MIDKGTNEREALFMGTGTVEFLDGKPVYSFSVPPGIFFTAFDRCWHDSADAWVVRAKVVATRRFNGSLQHAKLYYGTAAADDFGSVDDLGFPYEDLPNTRSAALRWYAHATGSTPFLCLDWEAHGASEENTSNPSTVKAHFEWERGGGDIMSIAMSLADARLTLEHYVDWK